MIMIIIIIVIQAILCYC